MVHIRCVLCGSEASAGSMKHPYCKKCFKKVFDNDYDKYSKFMIEQHGW